MRSSPWVARPLTDEELKLFEQLADRGYSVRSESNQGNVKFVVTKPQNSRKSRNRQT